MAKEASTVNKLWALGKVEPGWYVVRWVWDAAYAKHLQELGYEVRCSEESPGAA